MTPAVSSMRSLLCIEGTFLQNTRPADSYLQFTANLPNGFDMNLHEYQSKQLFARYGIPVPTGQIANSPEEAAEAARKIGGAKWRPETSPSRIGKIASAPPPCAFELRATST